MARRLACLALRDREGERFSGIIAGVTDFGLFVELACMPVEGMIRVQDLGDDWYELDSRNQCLMGQRSGLCWRLGQRLEVRLAEVHMGRLEIRLMPLECPRRAARGQGKQGRGKQRALRRVQEGAQRSRRKRGQKNGQAHDRNKDRSRKQGARTGKTGGGRPKRGR